MTSLCVVAAPISSESPASVTPSISAIRPQSTSTFGAANRIRSNGSNDCPPVITLASSPPSASAATASSTEVGRT